MKAATSKIRARTPQRRRILAVLVAGAAAVSTAGCGHGGATSPRIGAGSNFDGAALPRPVPAPGFLLRDVHGQLVSLARFRGRVTVLAFLYSGCRACVLIAQQIRGAVDELVKPPPVLIVSADPGRDTPAAVGGFLARTSLAGRARYLVGPPGELARVWRAYRVITPAHGLEAFEAAATVYLLDRGGRERVVYQQEQLTPEGLAHDIRVLEAG